MSTTDKIRSIISKDENEIAFVIGNGFNRHFNESNISWNDLLLRLWNQFSDSKITSIPSGVSFIEFYDALELQRYPDSEFSASLQKSVISMMDRWKPNLKQNILLSRIQDLEAPILTPNFDSLISESLDLRFHKLTGKGFTDYYPWSCYYSNNELYDPLDGFGVWHMNGMLKYYRSIKLSLTQYMGNVDRARKLIHEGSELFKFEGKNRHEWLGYQTWLHIVFNRDLFILGFGLDETEVFFRWLLIERAKYFKRFPGRERKGWYVAHSSEPSANDGGKRFFLESVGIEVVEADSYKTIYEDIWN